MNPAKCCPAKYTAPNAAVALASGVYRCGANYIVQYLPLLFTIFEVLEGPIHGGNELETPNCE
jgi:hypothetical protein